MAQGRAGNGARALDLLLAGPHCGASEVLELSQCCAALRGAAGEEAVWKALLTLRNGAVLRALFDDELPVPREGRTWKEHFFDFERDWLQLAQERSGRRLVRMNAVCAMGCDWPDYGVPWHLDQPRCACRGAICRRTRRAYGVYDVTEFTPLHPGSDALLRATEVADATALFDGIAHSQQARRLLRSMAVPGLEALVPWDALRPVPHRPETAAGRLQVLLCSAADWLCRELSSVPQRLRRLGAGGKWLSAVLRVSGAMRCPYS
mmetsp:Transcript_10418/g.27620  ORF Transcript_10418/g.27620 Transcript_10418/m.27620 type:complete len:263 (+) Transcript_10418:107-895(+)